ncbi:MAG: acyl carrier protein, partial [Polyangiales bacterium]
AYTGGMSDKLKDELRQIITEVTEVEDIPEDTPFADLGIDSMMAIEIVADVEKDYEITIGEDELSELTNLKAVYDKVKEKLGEAG